MDRDISTISKDVNHNNNNTPAQTRNSVNFATDDRNHQQINGLDSSEPEHFLFKCEYCRSLGSWLIFMFYCLSSSL